MGGRGDVRVVARTEESGEDCHRLGHVAALVHLGVSLQRPLPLALRGLLLRAAAPGEEGLSACAGRPLAPGG